MLKRRADNRKLAILLVVFLIVTVMSISLGKYYIPPEDIFRIMASKIFPITKTWPKEMETVLFNIRLPRILAAILIGASLSTAGAVYQGIFQNPMVSPDVLGAAHGAGFGASLALLLGWSYAAVTLNSFVFGIGSVMLAYLISTKAKGEPTLALVLAGMMISWLATAGTSYLKIIADPKDTLQAITFWLMGSLASIRIQDVLFILAPTSLGLLVIFLLRWRINTLTLTEQEAQSMGVNTKLYRLIFVVCATLITAASVSVSGVIQWAGLVVPHIARKIVGNDYRTLIPAVMLIGASYFMIVDDFARMLNTVEVPIGILTAFIGAPFFIYLILRRKE